MPFLNVAGSTISVGLVGPEKKVVEIGHRQRAFDGTLRSTIRTTKNEWAVSTIPLLRSAANSIETALLSTASLSAYGDLPGVTSTAPITVQVANIEWEHIGAPGSSGRVVLRFSMLTV